MPAATLLMASEEVLALSSSATTKKCAVCAMECRCASSNTPRAFRRGDSSFIAMCRRASPYVPCDHCPQFEARVVAAIAGFVAIVPSSAEVDSTLAKVEVGIAVVVFAAVVVVAADSNHFEPPVIEIAMVDSSSVGMAHFYSAAQADFHFGTARAAASVDSSLVPAAEAPAMIAPNPVVV